MAMAYTRSKVKTLENFPNNYPCLFCKQTKSDVDLYGKIYQYNDITTHHFCMLFSSQMEQNGKDEEGIQGFLPYDIKKELIRGRKLNCVYCHKDGATVKCAGRGCKKRYHFPCAVDNDAMHEFFNQFRSFCFQHRQPQEIPLRPFERSICLMCREDVPCEPSSLDSVWAPCCQTVWYHRMCLQRTATSAGYFFKCPNCNNKKIFRKGMLECGIYIPDQDASWEMESNAFRELSERYSNCDAEICDCPNGRKHSTSDGKWKVILCSLCGSQGMHVHCGKENIESKSLWTCDFCASVVSKMPAPTPGSSTNTDIRRPRYPRERRKRIASETRDTPALKTAVIDAKENTSESTTCLYDNGGQAIHVVKLDNIDASCDNVIEIGGVNVVEIGGMNVVSNVIALESSDEDEAKCENEPLARLSHIIRANSHQFPLPTIRRNLSSPISELPSLVIDLLDSDDESPNTNETCSKLSTRSVDDDEDVVFMGCHLPAKNPVEKEQTSAMIRIVQNDNILLLPATEVIRQDGVKQTTAAGSSANVIASNDRSTSDTMWQSVPRHKSMVHSIPQNLTQTIIHDKNFNHINETNRTTTQGTKEQRWIPKTLPNGAIPSNRGFGPVTSSYVTGINEVIDLD